jgi:hypothetical protein
MPRPQSGRVIVKKSKSKGRDMSEVSFIFAVQDGVMAVVLSAR